MGFDDGDPDMCVTVCVAECSSRPGHRILYLCEMVSPYYIQTDGQGDMYVVNIIKQSVFNSVFSVFIKGDSV